MGARLQDKVVAITGAAGGIGEGVARALLEEGALLSLWDLSAEATQRVADRLDPEGTRVLGLAADVTDPAAVTAAIQATTERFGRLDGLVNNAGVIMLASSWDEDAAHWRKHLDVNVTGTFVCSRAAAEVFRAAGGGAIVNVASNCGKIGYRNMAAYNASKSAVIGLTRSLSMEWAEAGINVNAVCPGAVDTPMLGQVADWLSPRVDVPADELLAGMGLEQLGGRRIDPIEVGRVIAFLLSEEAIIIRGQSINVDAGDTPY